MTITPRTRRLLAAGAVLAVGGATAAVQSTSWANEGRPGAMKIDHIVVIYEENHSFDNLFGGWEGVNGLTQAASSGHQTQVAADGSVLPCLPQNDVNLKVADTGGKTCSVTAPDGKVLTSSWYDNAPFNIDRYITPTDRTCPPLGSFSYPNGITPDDPAALPGGCTRDLIHRYYTEQYQIDGGKQDKYVAGSDAIGLSMGYYDTTKLPIYQYLHGPDAPRYAVADDFFQSAFGGSFLNHQWLIAAATPTWPGATADGSANDLHTVVPADGNPASTPLHPVPNFWDKALTARANPDGSCAVQRDGTLPPAGTTCGDWAVNTIQPASRPYGGGAQLPLQTGPTIGDRLSDKGVDWAWYSGGWDDAAGIVGGPGWTSKIPGACDPTTTTTGATYPYCAHKTFQYHHQPFNYYARYAAPTDPTKTNPERDAHLRDEVEFMNAAKTGTPLRTPGSTFGSEQPVGVAARVFWFVYPGSLTSPSAFAHPPEYHAHGTCRVDSSSPIVLFVSSGSFAPNAPDGRFVGCCVFTE